MRQRQISSRPLHEISRAAKERALELIRERERRLDRDRCEGRLIDFVQGGWKYIDPNPYVHGWHLEAVAEHLEAVVRGEIRNLLINVPPRTSKSSITSVAFPAWVWAQRDTGPLSGPQVQFLFASYSHSISMRDSVKTRRLVESPWYQDRWGDRFELTGDQNTKIRFETSKGGYRLATSTGGSLTGEGAAIIVCDDVHNAVEAESEVIRTGVLSWWDEALSTRLNDPKTGAFVVVMQRLHKNDLAGHILEHNRGDWAHLCLPMEYEPRMHCVTSIGWEDPRSEEGELLCPERFGPKEIQTLKIKLGPIGAAGQLQQRPQPKGGNIFKDEWWQPYDLPTGASPRHKFDYIVASLDPAYTSKEENDPSGFCVFGVYQENNRPKVLLLFAWRKYLELIGETLERLPGETNKEYERRCRPHWGLVERVAYDCKRLRVTDLIIENKASGLSVAQALRRLFRHNEFGIRMHDPGRLDKRARAVSIQSAFSDGIVHVPVDPASGMMRDFATLAVEDCSAFRGLPGDEDNLVDAIVQAIIVLQQNHFILRADEIEHFERQISMHKERTPLPYDV